MAIATGNSYTMGTILEEVMDKNLRMFPILFKQFKHIQYAFFDVKQLAGEGGMSLKMKEIPGIESTITVDGYSVKWIDYAVFDFNTTVKADQTITLSSYASAVNVTATTGFAVNDSVHFIMNDAGTSVEADGIVTAVTDSDTLAVKFNTIDGVSATTSQSFALKDGSRVERGFWKRNDNDEITRPSALYDYTEYHSYIQHFSRRIEFTKAELNKEYKYEGEAKNEAGKRFTYNLGILFQEVNKAIYKGRNVAPGSGAQDKMEMLGLEEICRESGTIKDLSASTDPIRDLFKEFEYSFQTGSIVGNEPIMCMVNDKFLTELAQANGDKVRYDKYVEELRYTIPTVSTIYGEVEFIRDPMLNKLYNYSACITLPRSLLKLWVRENQSYEPKGGITKSDQSIKVFPVVHNLREKELYDIELELGLIAGGLSAEKVPFRFIKNFAA